MEKDLSLQCNERRAGDRRCRRWNFVLHENRSGFDRRECERSAPGDAIEYTLVRMRDCPRVLLVVLVAVNVLNIADFALTLNVLASGGGEANPIMASLFERSPVWAGVFKLVAVALATWLVWRCRRFRSALVASLLMAGVFAAVLFYHVWGLAVAG